MVVPPQPALRSHASTIVDQFSRQAELFAQSPALHNDAALTLLVDAGAPQANDDVLDVACGPGSVVVAFASRVRRSVGLDATEAMLAQARSLASTRNLTNTEWPGRRLLSAVRRCYLRHCQLPLCVSSFRDAGTCPCRDGARLPARRPHRAL